MHRIITALIFIILVSGCSLSSSTDPCHGDFVPIMFSNYGPAIEDSVYLRSDSVYTYNIENEVYVADLAGGGRNGCPEKNKRIPNVDSLIIENNSIASAKIVDGSLLRIQAVEPGSTSVTVYMSATVGGGPFSTYYPKVSTHIIVSN